MPLDAAPLVGFNRGIISPRGLARIDMKRTAMSAERQENFLPHVLGSMMLRPGTGYLSSTFNNAQAVSIPFVFSASDLARLEITNQTFRPLVNDIPITRAAVGTVVANSTFAPYVTNGGFVGNSTGWTLGAGWAYGTNNLVATTSSAAATQNTAIAIVNGHSYTVTYTITRTAGSVTPSLGGTNGTTRSAAGTYTDTIVAGATQVLAFTGAAFSGTLATVMVEVVSATEGWVDADDAGSASRLTTSGLTISGTVGSSGRRRQHIVVAGGDQATLHALRILVSGPGGTVGGGVNLRIGTSSGADDLQHDTILGAGTHSISFTPGGADVWVEFYAPNIALVTVTSCTIEGAGVLTLPTPWLTSDLPSLRWEASEDVTWIACYGYQTRKIERRGSGVTASWSVVIYSPPDGPFMLRNSGVMTMTPSGLTGDITIAASQKFFYPTHVGSLFQLSSLGQVIDTSFTGTSQFSNPIKVTGGAGQRTFNINVSGTFTGTVQLQSSVGDVGAFTNVAGGSWTWTAPTAAAGVNYTDGLNGQIVYYRLACTAYTSGTIVTELTISQGSVDGVVQITGYTDSQNVSAAVLSPLGGTAASALWRQGAWSNIAGWPSLVQLNEGRLFFMGLSQVWASLPDAFESFDITQVGDSGIIARTYGAGPQDRAMWSASMQRLVVGGAMDEWSFHSDSFDNPLTPSNFSVRRPSTQGAANVPSVQVDARALFVGRSTTKLFEVSMNNQGGFIFDYTTTNMGEAVPELLLPGISRIAVQRHPDTRIHCVLNDGTVAILVSDPNEDVTAWILYTLPGGFVEDVHVLPGAIEDSVYYTVKRTVNAATVRYHEKFALQMTQCQGGTVNLQMDSFLTGTQAPSTTISVPHLVGQSVVVWADGAPLVTSDPSVPRTFTVSGGGTITVPNAATTYAVGLPYKGVFKSSKLAYAPQGAAPLSNKKRIESLSLILYNTYYQGIQYGKDGAKWENLPLKFKGAPAVAGTVYQQYDQEKFPFPGVWDADTRLWLQAQSPFPCTVLGAIMTMNADAG